MSILLAKEKNLLDQVDIIINKENLHPQLTLKPRQNFTRMNKTLIAKVKTHE
jgi:hypothetical protein